MKDELLFKLKPPGARGRGLAPGEAARIVGSFIRSTSGLAIAESAAAFAAEAMNARAALRSALAFDLSEVTRAAEAMRSQAREMFASASPLAEQMHRAAGETARAAASYVASLPEDAREELRRAAEDAPLCPVDVNAGGVM